MPMEKNTEAWIETKMFNTQIFCDERPHLECTNGVTIKWLQLTIREISSDSWHKFTKANIKLKLPSLQKKAENVILMPGK